MTCKESDLGAEILQKLEATEDLLKSFMASLEGPLPKKGGELVPVEAPIAGEIRWYLRSGTRVKRGDSLCVIEGSRDTEEVHSPATGTLSIRPGLREVRAGMTIATIETDFALI